jgi:hypothetical protein
MCVLVDELWEFSKVATADNNLARSETGAIAKPPGLYSVKAAW